MWWVVVAKRCAPVPSVEAVPFGGGMVKGISNTSCHYHPTLTHLRTRVASRRVVPAGDWGPAHKDNEETLWEKAITGGRRRFLTPI
jgi:hypothetical protein